MLPAGTRSCASGPRVGSSPIGARSRPGLDAQRPGRCPSRTRAGPWLKRPRAAWSADPRKHLTAADPGGPLPALIVPRPPVADRDSASRALGTCIHSEAPPGTHDMEHSAPSRPFPGADGLPRRAHNRFAGCRPDPAGGVSIPNRRGTRSTLSALEAPAPHCACREAHASRPSSPGAATTMTSTAPCNPSATTSHGPGVDHFRPRP